MIFQTVKDKSKPIPFADGTSTIFTNSNPTDFLSNIRILFEYVNKWFTANSISPNFDNTNFIQLTTKMDPKVTWNVSYARKIISKEHDTKFLGLHTRQYTVLGNIYSADTTHTKCGFLCHQIC
jgi:hypothetical protein